jgi:hypothetical protein
MRAAFKRAKRVRPSAPGSSESNPADRWRYFVGQSTFESNAGTRRWVIGIKIQENKLADNRTRYRQDLKGHEIDFCIDAAGDGTFSDYYKRDKASTCSLFKWIATYSNNSKKHCLASKYRRFYYNFDLLCKLRTTLSMVNMQPARVSTLIDNDIFKLPKSNAKKALAFQYLCIDL